MSFLDRLLRKADRPVSQLDEFLAKIDRSQIHARAREAQETELRTATAISLLVLEQSGRFTRDLFGAFETAAFIHYALLAEHLGSPDEFDADDEDDDEVEADPYVAAVRHAHHLTALIVNSLVSFKANEKIFENRPIAYAMRAAWTGIGGDVRGDSDRGH